MSPEPMDLVTGEDDLPTVPSEGMALCLSGGGYRAMLFHVGALWRMNELGLLPALRRVSSVSGGSIIAGLLGIRWHALDFRDGVARKLGPLVFEPIRRLACHTIDVPAVILGFIWPGKAAFWIRRCYDRYLFHGAELCDLPDARSGPRFVMNATSLQTGVMWRFCRPFMGDFKVGRVPDPAFSLALAVAASSAFPPVLSPVILRLNPEAFRLAGQLEPCPRQLRERVILSDGGVYDNLGLETVWKRFSPILVSDGGQKMGTQTRPWGRWLLQAKRVLDVVDNQVRSLRKRHLIDRLQSNTSSSAGAYWGIGTDISKYPAPEKFLLEMRSSTTLAAIPTRLRRMEPAQQEQLINWGYVVCDAALRSHLDPTLPSPGRLPYPRGDMVAKQQREEQTV